VQTSVPRAFTKFADNRTVDVPFPAGLGDLFGAEVAEWSALDPARPWQVGFGEHAIAAPLWAEVLRPGLANPIAEWGGSYAAGLPAITACAYGKGLAVYSGAYPTEELLAQLWPRLLPAAARLPADVERIALVDGGVLWLNHSEQPATVPLQGAWRDRLTNEELHGSCALLGLAVRWLVPGASS
jgi:beta-galactosidase